MRRAVARRYNATTLVFVDTEHDRMRPPRDKHHAARLGTFSPRVQKMAPPTPQSMAVPVSTTEQAEVMPTRPISAKREQRVRE